MHVDDMAPGLRRHVDEWLQQEGLSPVVAGEFDDSALMKVFGENGVGAFVAPSLIEREVRQRHRVAPIGSVAAIRGRIYAITVERRVKHPAVVAMTQAARSTMADAAPVPTRRARGYSSRASAT